MLHVSGWFASCLYARHGETQQNAPAQETGRDEVFPDDDHGRPGPNKATGSQGAWLTGGRGSRVVEPPGARCHSPEHRPLASGQPILPIRADAPNHGRDEFRVVTKGRGMGTRLENEEPMRPAGSPTTINGWRPPLEESLMLPNAITIAGRIFMARRKARPAPPGRASLFHAVTPHCRMSLCAVEPGAGSSWAEPPAEAVTCPECLRRLARIGRGS
jgi:hypothetical protein